MGSTAASSRGERTIRMPLPPPPADGLSSTGYPMRSASSSACASSPMSPEPGIVGRPWAPSRRRVSSFEANRSRTSAGGPMNVRSWARTASANASSSLRKP